MPGLIVLLVLTCAVTAPLQAQNDTAALPLHTVVMDDAATTLEDGLSFWSTPARFSGGDWIVAGGTVAGIIGIMAWDGDLRDKLSVSEEEEPGTLLWKLPTWYGDLRYAGVLSAGTYAAGLFGGDRSVRITGRMLLESFALSGSMVMALRYLTGRAHPVEGADPWAFGGFRWDNADRSFPSGHATIAFALSTVLADRIDNPLADIGLYGMASFTALARVRHTQHWVSDVVVGALLGAAAGLHVAAREHGREGTTGERGGLSIIPGPTGLRLQYDF